MPVLLIVAHLDPVNGRPQHTKYAEDDKKDYSWTEADGYEECDEFLKFRKGPKPKPMSEICSNLQYGCVPYNKLNSSGCGYEKRKLLGGYWVTTYIDPKAPNGYREAYMRLHGYRSGAKNSVGKFLGMNVPVMKEWRPEQGSSSKFQIATMSFYVPGDYQSNPPDSLDPDMIVEEWEDTEIYVRAYGGSRHDPEYLQQFDHLKKALAKKNITTVSDLRMTSGYGRRVEVILFGTPTPGDEHRPLKEIIFDEKSA